MPKNPKKSEEICGKKDGKNLSEKEYKAKVAEWYGLALEDLGLDRQSGLVWYKARYDPNTGDPLYPLPLRHLEGGFYRDVEFGCNASRIIKGTLWFQPKFEWKLRKSARTIGLRLGNLADLTAIARTWRKPGYKKLRHVYVKDSVIAGHDFATRRQADTFGQIGYTREGVKHIKDRIVELGTRYVFMIHNCPSADYTPPSVDQDLISLCKSIPELKAHIIIYTDSLDFIGLKQNIIIRVVQNIPGRPPNFGESHMRLSRLDASPQLAAWANALTGERDFTVISLAEKGPIRNLRNIRFCDIDTWGKHIE